MKTPIVDFVRDYAAREVSRFHMPGHKGKPFLGVEGMDITEVAGADVLYDAAGIIEESEQNAAALFGSAHTYYSTEGSTLAIKAMLSLVAICLPRGTRPHFLAARNVHRSFLFGVAALDAKVTWMYPTKATHLCACPLTPRDVENALERCEKKPHAVYLTSPDYLGNEADIAGIAAVCDAHGVPLLVDNAHGAYLQFLSPSRHPLALGAAMCADSAHKTLPVLTGGSYLHISQKAPECYVKNARNALSLFASTSPSYLVMQSLDLCNEYLASGYSERLAACIERVDRTRSALAAHGYAVAGGEPLKLVIEAGKFGYTGEELADALRKGGIEPEFADEDYLVLMCTPENGEEDFVRLARVLCALPKKTPKPPFLAQKITPVSVISVREAVFAPAELLPVEKAVGRICATPAVSCPPAVPIVVTGERVDEAAISLFRHYGITEISVVKE